MFQRISSFAEIRLGRDDYLKPGWKRHHRSAFAVRNAVAHKRQSNNKNPPLPSLELRRLVLLR